MTKDRAERLTVEQKELLASLELKRIERRQQLFERASRCKVGWFSGLWFALCPFIVLVPFLAVARITLVLCLTFGAMICIVFGFSFAIQSEMKNVNERIDALIELLELDQEKKDPDL